MSLVIEIERIGNQLFELNFGSLKPGTVKAAAIAAAGTVTTVAARAWTAIALRTITATAIFTVGRAAAGTWAPITTLPTLGAITLGTGFARRTVALRTGRALTFRPGRTGRGVGLGLFGFVRLCGSGGLGLKLQVAECSS
jgi:hypothetical protein